MAQEGNGNQPLQIPQSVRLSAKEFGSKFSTKRECFTFLTIDCHAYLPSYDTVTIYFVSHSSSSDPIFFLYSSRIWSRAARSSLRTTSASTCRCRSTSH